MPEWHLVQIGSIRNEVLPHSGIQMERVSDSHSFRYWIPF